MLGLEASAALKAIEIPHRCGPRAGLEGLVFVEILTEAAEGGEEEQEAAVRGALGCLRSAYAVTRLTSIVELPQGADSLARLCEVLVNDATTTRHLLPDIRHHESFRVRCSRLGVHAFRSIDVERLVGEVLHESMGVAGKMKGAQLVVRADVIGAKVVIGYQLHNDELTKRLHPVFIRDASVRPNVAFALLHLAGAKDGDTVLDPFAGSGTIILEAAVRLPNSRLYGVEKSERVLAGAVANAESLGLLPSDRLSLVVGNARALYQYVPRGSIDAIVTNPPWGIRVGKTDDVDDLYRGFLASAADVLRVGGRMAVLVVRWEGFLQYCRQSGRWVVHEARPVRTGDMLPVLFVLERVEDVFWTSIKGGIHQMVRAAKEGDGTEEVQPARGPETGARKRRVSQ